MFLRKLFFYLSWILFIGHAGYGQYDDGAYKHQQFYYSGSLGDDEKIELNLRLEGEKASGSYIQPGNGDIFLFNGLIREDEVRIDLNIFNAQGELVAKADLRIVSETNNFASHLKGVWKPVNGAVVKTIELRKVANMAKFLRSDCTLAALNGSAVKQNSR